MERPSKAAHACSGVEEAPITTVWQTAVWTVSLRHHCFGDLSSGFALVFLLCFVRLCSFFWSCSVFDHSRPPYFLIQLTHILAALETSACDTCDLWTIKKTNKLVVMVTQLWRELWVPRRPEDSPGTGSGGAYGTEGWRPPLQWNRPQSYKHTNITDLQVRAVHFSETVESFKAVNVLLMAQSGSPGLSGEDLECGAGRR